MEAAPRYVEPKNASELGVRLELRKLSRREDACCYFRAVLFVQGHGKAKVMVIIYRSPSRVAELIAMHRYLRDDGCPMPWSSTAWTLWDRPILISEKTSRLRSTHDLAAVERDLSKQLRVLHTLPVRVSVSADAVIVNGQGMAFFKIYRKAERIPDRARVERDRQALALVIGEWERRRKRPERSGRKPRLVKMNYDHRTDDESENPAIFVPACVLV